jgi:hypothetical protein
VVCEHCGTVFCWDNADIASLGGSRKRFCSKSCKTSASNKRTGVRALSTQAKRSERRLARRLEACRERGKPQYGSETLAKTTALRLYAAKGWMLYPYNCPCGFWHLTSEKPADVDEGEFFRSFESPAFRDWEARAAGRR